MALQKAIALQLPSEREVMKRKANTNIHILPNTIAN